MSKIILFIFACTIVTIAFGAEKQLLSPEFLLKPHAYASSSPEPLDFNMAIAGDWGCTGNTHKTIRNIIDKDPELVLAPGDFSYSDSPDCWFQEISPFVSKTKISMGNHDEEEDGSAELRTAYMTHFNLSQSFYSYNYENVHVLAMDTQLPYDVGSEQYRFIEEDLRAASTDNKIDWILVMFHKPIYSSPAAHSASDSERVIFHPLFDRYGVDLVIQAHNHIYEQTTPLKFNNANSSEPIIDNSDTGTLNGKYYRNPFSPIFLVVGTGGESLHDIKERHPYTVYSSDKDYGFLNIEIKTNNNSSGNILNAKFYANSDTNAGTVIDELFTISK